MTDASITDVMKFMEMKTTEFRTEWKQLTDKDKADLKSGIGNGTLTY